MSVPLVKKNIGREKSEPLKAHRQKGHLNHGIHGKQSTTFGTVARAGL